MARYAALRVEWGGAYVRKLARFLQIQAIAGLPLFLGIAVAAHRPGDLQWVDLLAGVLVLGGIVGTAVADLQLEAYKARGLHGGVCDIGCGAGRATRITSSNGFRGAVGR